MSSKPTKVQVYLDADVHSDLEKIADDRQISLSKAAARMIERGVINTQQLAFQNKTQSMLGHILASVYDYDIAKKNSEEVKDLIKHIDERLLEKIKS